MKGQSVVRLLASKTQQKNKENGQVFTRCRIGLANSILLNCVVVLLFHILCAFFLDISLLAALKCVVWYNFMLVLPGAAIHQMLLPTQRDFLSFSFISCAAGYCLSIILYFVTVPFGLQAVIPYVTVLIATFSIWFLLRKHKGAVFEYGQSNAVAVLFFAYLFLCSIAYAGCLTHPSKTGSAWYPTDLVWWMENAIALTKEFPPSDLRVSGSVFSYHYFSSIQLAIQNLATGVDVFTLASAFYPLIKCYIYFGSIYVLLVKMAPNIYIRVFSLCLVLFCTGVETVSVVTHVAHSLSAPFGMDVGFGIAAIMLYFFYLQYEKEKIDYKLWVAVVLTAAVCVGTKAPIAVIAIAATGFICMVWFFGGKYKISLFYGIGLLAAFFAVSIAFEGLLNPEAERIGNFSLIAFIGRGRLSELFLNICFPLRYIICAVIYVICIHPLLISLFALGGISLILDRRKWKLWDFGMLFGGILGLLLGIFNVQGGNSQMYFSMAAFLPMLVLGTRYLEQQWKASGKAVRRLIVIVCSLIMLSQMVLFCCHGYSYFGKGGLSDLRQGWRNISCVEQEFRADGIQREDAEGLEWIRENTAADSVLLSDRSVVGWIPNYMYYGLFSERQMFLEGDIYDMHFSGRPVEVRNTYRQIILDVFQNKDCALREAKANGVTHIVQTKWLTPNFAPNPKLAEIIYETDSIAVWVLT